MRKIVRIARNCGISAYIFVRNMIPTINWKIFVVPIRFHNFCVDVVPSGFRVHYEYRGIFHINTKMCGLCGCATYKTTLLENRGKLREINNCN